MPTLKVGMLLVKTKHFYIAYHYNSIVRGALVYHYIAQAQIETDLVVHGIVIES